MVGIKTIMNGIMNTISAIPQRILEANVTVRTYQKSMNISNTNKKTEKYFKPLTTDDYSIS